MYVLFLIVFFVHQSSPVNYKNKPNINLTHVKIKNSLNKKYYKNN